MITRSIYMVGFIFLLSLSGLHLAFLKIIRTSWTNFLFPLHSMLHISSVFTSVSPDLHQQIVPTNLDRIMMSYSYSNLNLQENCARRWALRLHLILNFH